MPACLRSLHTDDHVWRQRGCVQGTIQRKDGLEWRKEEQPSATVTQVRQHGRETTESGAAIDGQARIERSPITMADCVRSASAGLPAGLQHGSGHDNGGVGLRESRLVGSNARDGQGRMLGPADLDWLVVGLRLLRFNRLVFGGLRFNRLVFGGLGARSEVCVWGRGGV